MGEIAIKTSLSIFRNLLKINLYYFTWSHLGDIYFKKCKFIEGKSKRILIIFVKILTLSFLSRKGNLDAICLIYIFVGIVGQKEQNIKAVNLVSEAFTSNFFLFSFRF